MPERLLAAIFLCSGAAALIFQVVWLYLCGLVFGNSLWAASLVLAAFMGGLALGSGLAARFGPRIRRPLRAYAVAEAVVAAAGIALTLTLPELARVLAPVFQPIFAMPWLTNSLRLIIAFALLMVPCTAMGLTLPLLVGVMSRSEHGFGAALGRLYGWNTVGAMAGVIGAEFVLVPALGITATAIVAGLLCLVAAGTAGLLAARYVELQEAMVDATRASGLAAARRPLIAAALSGANLLAFEVIGFRFLSMFVVSSAQAMSLMLAAVLIGIALGGLLAGVWLRRRPDVIHWLPAIGFSACVATVLSYAGFQRWTGEASQFNDWYMVAYLALRLMTPVAVLSGMLFTFQGAAIRRNVGSAAQTTGLLVLANTLGAMVGALAAGFLLLPALGMELSIFLLSALYLVVGLLLIPNRRAKRTRLPTYIPYGAALAALSLLLFPFGLMREEYFPRSARPFVRDGATLVEAREASTATLFHVRQDWMGQPVYHRLITNGFSMAGTTNLAQRYMRFFVYWPLAMQDPPMRNALLLCYGLGETAGALLDVPSLESLDIVDTSRDILSLSHRIYQGRRDPLNDPRVEAHIEDGRYFLQTTARRYDLVTAEPPPPRAPGVVSLYTREHFQLIYDRLTEGGVATYWLPMADLAADDAAPIIRGFCDVFSDCSLWASAPVDWMLVGTRNLRGPVPESRFVAPWSNPVTAQKLREVAFESPEDIGTTFMADAARLKALVAQVPALTDEYPRRLRPLYSARSYSRAQLESFLETVDPARAHAAFESSAYIASLWPGEIRRRTLASFDDQQVIRTLQFEGPDVLSHIEQLHFALTATDRRTLPLMALAGFDVQLEIANSYNDGTGGAEYVLAKGAFAERKYEVAEEYLRLSQERGFSGPTLVPLRVYALCLMGRLEAARDLARTVPPPANRSEVHFWNWMTKTFGVSPRRQAEAR